LTYIDTSVVAEAFLHHEKRQVDKGACISFRGKKYETKPSLIGFEVEIAYDPMTPEMLTIHHPGIADFQARPLKIGAFCDKNPTLPVTMQETEPKSSRFLDALEKKRDENHTIIANAISFKGFTKGGADHV